MNFRFTKGKVIWSVVIIIIVNILYWYLISPYGGIAKVNISVAIMMLISPAGLVYLLLSFVLIYIIWSLFQKKRD